MPEREGRGEHRRSDISRRRMILAARVYGFILRSKGNFNDMLNRKMFVSHDCPIEDTLGKKKRRKNRCTVRSIRKTISDRATRGGGKGTVAAIGNDIAMYASFTI